MGLVYTERWSRRYEPRVVYADGHTHGQSVIGWPGTNTDTARSKCLYRSRGRLHGLGYARKYAHGIESYLMPDIEHQDSKSAEGCMGKRCTYVD